MAELTFIGAAGTVTGSKHLITVDGKRVLIDCGLFQGVSDVRSLNDVPLPVDPRSIDAVVVTHGHLDHVGYLPKLVRDGFAGPVYCTPPTQDVMQIVLDDSAHLQEELRERGFHHERPQAPPMYYDERDVVEAMRRAQPVGLETPFEVASAVKATYHNAGHILGSAFVSLQLDGRRVVFSGDLGRYGRPLLFDPSPIGDADTIVCESTYGDRDHPADSNEDLRQALLQGIARGGAIVIPAFAVERTQDILLSIGALQHVDSVIAGVPVHVDSPMAEKIDTLFARYPTYHRPIPGENTSAPFGVKNLVVHETAQESKQLNDMKGPHIIIASSGMASGGRILHHLHNHLADSKATIVFCGYQSAGTLGYLLVHGAHTIRIFGDALPVRASIAHLEGFSAHAGRSEFKRWFATCDSKPALYAVHGEAQSAAALVALAHEAYNWNAQVARRGTTVEL